MSFIKEQKKEARDRIGGLLEEYIFEEFGNELDSLISQVVQNTVSEIERRVEEMILKDPSPEGQYNAIIYSHNEAVKEFQSLLKDITNEDNLK